YILEDSDCSVLFAGNDFATLVNQLEMDELQTITIGPEWSEWIPGQTPPMQASAHFYSSHVTYDLPGVLPEPDEIFLQLYTSGTTSKPKGVPLTHFNVVALLEQLRLEIPGFGTDSRNLVCAPFFHIAGVGCLFLGLFGGAANFVLPRFDPLAVIEGIGKLGLTHGLMVPAMQQAVISHPEARKGDFHSLKHLIYGASPISRSLLMASHSVLQCDYTQAYGLTETTGVATILSMDDHRAILSGQADHLAASAGKPAAGIEMEIRNEDGICNAGESG
ncbi:MAG: AMP-binding protein, partial [Leptospiraceae bacterium]|nr:AMP-binding protein [Leptospiraceae bacterium]